MEKIRRKQDRALRLGTDSERFPNLQMNRSVQGWRNVSRGEEAKLTMGCIGLNGELWVD